MHSACGSMRACNTKGHAHRPTWAHSPCQTRSNQSACADGSTWVGADSRWYYAGCLRGPPLARWPPGMTSEAVWLSHQKAVKARSVVHFVSAVYRRILSLLFKLATSARPCQKSQIRADSAFSQRSSGECRFKGLKNFQDGHSAPRRQAATPTSCTTSSAPADVFAVARKASDTKSASS